MTANIMMTRRMAGALKLVASAVLAASAQSGVAGGFVNSGTPRGVPLSTDCSLRAEVWSFGQALLPRKQQFQELYDALQLGACASAPPRPADDAPWQPPIAPVAAPNALTVIADAARGSDVTGDGSLTRPLRSLEAALAAVRARRAARAPCNASIQLRAAGLGSAWDGFQTGRAWIRFASSRCGLHLHLPPPRLSPLNPGGQACTTSAHRSCSIPQTRG